MEDNNEDDRRILSMGKKNSQVSSSAEQHVQESEHNTKR